MAIPESSIIIIGYQIIIDELTASFCWPFEVWGYACGSSVVSTLASGARGPRFDPCPWQG